MKHNSFVFLAVILGLSSMSGADDWWKALTHNDRFKAVTYKDAPIIGTSGSRSAEGIWAPDDQSKPLALPLQVRIDCDNYGTGHRKCLEIDVTLVPMPALVSVQGINTQEYQVDTWDADGLVASYGGGEISSRCQRHVLTMDFQSGHVTAVDIPTHKKGCEPFVDSNSYHLVRGNYYVDTSTNNDIDKRRKVESK